MSFQVTEAFVQQFSSNFYHLSQQMESRFGSAVRVEAGIVGDSKKINRIGATAAQKKTTRHGDTPLIETPHSTRWIDLDDYEWADLVDELDKKKMLSSPDSEYLKAGISAMNAISVYILRSPFMPVFIGTTLSCAVLVGQSRPFRAIASKP